MPSPLGLLRSGGVVTANRAGHYRTLGTLRVRGVALAAADLSDEADPLSDCRDQGGCTPSAANCLPISLRASRYLVHASAASTSEDHSSARVHDAECIGLRDDLDHSV